MSILLLCSVIYGLGNKIDNFTSKNQQGTFIHEISRLAQAKRSYRTNQQLLCSILLNLQ